MAPSKQTTKRVAQEQPAKSAKKQRADAIPDVAAKSIAQQTAKAAKKPRVDPTLEAVTDAIKCFGDVPETCREMLLAVLPGCFAAPSETPSAERALFMGMLGEFFDDSQASLQHEVDAADASIVEIEGSKEGLEGKVLSAEAAVVAATEMAAARQSALSEATKASEAAKKALDDAHSAKLEGEASLGRALPEKEAIEKAIEVDLKALIDGELEAGLAKKHIDVMLGLAKQAGVDSSLVTSIPSACTKPPSGRGTFDNMVMDQLGQSLNNRVADLTSKLASGAEDSATNVARVEAAQSVYDANEVSKQVAADQFCAATGNVTEAEASLKAAKAAVTDFGPTLKLAMDTRSEKQAVLEKFVSWNMAAFGTLRDNSSGAAAETQVAAAPEVADLDTTAPEVADLETATPKGADLETAAVSVVECGA